MQEKRQNISPIKQRILYFADSLKISKREFYKQIGVSRGTLESNTGITEDVMAKFIATYPDISLDWLIKGEGNMLRDTSIQHTEPTIIFKSDPKDAATIADKQMIIERDAELIAALREKIKTLEAKLPTHPTGLYGVHSAGSIQEETKPRRKSDKFKL